MSSNSIHDGRAISTSSANRYTEAYDSVSSIHVDHYRPKGRITDLDGNKFEGYWWLAFEWKTIEYAGN